MSKVQEGHSWWKTTELRSLKDFQVVGDQLDIVVMDKVDKKADDPPEGVQEVLGDLCPDECHGGNSS